MARKKLNVKAVWMNGSDVVNSAKDATYLLIIPDEDAPVITIGRNDHDNCLGAMTFAQDQYRFGWYTHPMTDFQHDVIVHSDVDVSKDAQGRFNCPYREEAAFVGPASPFETGDNWWIADLVKRNSSLVLQPTRVIDPVDHTDEIVAAITKRMKERKAAWPRIKAACDNAKRAEQDRADGDQNRLAKARWGQYEGYAFKIWIAHIRQRAELAFKIVNEPDTKKALELRNEKIHGKVVYDRYVKGKLDGIAPDEPEATDEPDAAEGEAKEAEPEVQAVTGIVMPFVKNGKLSGKTADLMKLDKGIMITLWVIEGARLTQVRGWSRTWNPDNESLTSKLREFAVPTTGGNPRYAIEFAEAFLKG